MPHNNTAWWVDHANGTHQLYQADYTPPPLKPGQILIENHYAGINYKDALSVTGKAPISRLPSIIPGQDLSGVVIESHRRYTSTWRCCTEYRTWAWRDLKWQLCPAHCCRGRPGF